MLRIESQLISVITAGLFIAACAAMSAAQTDTQTGPPDNGTDFKAASAPSILRQYHPIQKPLAQDGHWSFTLKPDEYVVRDGVLLEKGTSVKHPIVLTGVSEQPP